MRVKLILGIVGLALTVGAHQAHAQQLAFPRAEGFGAHARGGRGGQVLEVTNLNDAGAGSLRKALEETTGPRIVVFRVSGTIELESSLCIRGEGGSFVTVAGQTSPGGVQLKGDGIVVRDQAHDVVIRYLRVRPGAHLPELRNTNGFIAWGTDGKPVHDIIVDHCSFQWSTDQNGPDAWHGVTHYTSQWNIIARGTTEGHPNGSPHSTGILVGAASADEPITMSIHHCLFAHNGGRNPLISSATVVDFRNNVVYNWGGNNGAQWGNYSEGTLYGKGTACGNIVNNHYISGPNSGLPYFWLANGGPTRLDGTPAEGGGTKVYTAGNWGPNCPTGGTDDWMNGFLTLDYWSQDGSSNFPEASESQFRVFTPFAAPPVQTDPTNQVKSKVLATVGASRPYRDALDAEIVADVENGTGRIEDTQSGGPWPDLTGPASPPDTDHDGMPDAWEARYGLDPSDPADGSAFHDNGWTNLENYLN